MVSEHSQGRFIWLHQTVVLFAGIVGPRISDSDVFTFFCPLFAGLFPFLLAFRCYWRTPEPDDAARIHTYIISSLIGVTFAFAIMICWASWAVAVMYSGFH